ncbi:MAG: hypothetical protein IH624_19900 [Phycisphaerae bacterium]|nr:hypothetical protein [Phycisphaerae bacterium]
MLDTRQTIINTFHDHIKNHGGGYKNWRIGVCTAEDSRTLNLPAAAETLTIQKALSVEDATAVMAYFVYIYDVVRDQQPLVFEDCDVVYLYKVLADNPNAD